MIWLIIIWVQVLLAILPDGKPHDSRRAAQVDSDKFTPVVILLDPIDTIHELRPGDILVKPNHNWLPGTTWINGGKGLGHAAIVIEGARDTNILQLLQ